MVWCFVFTMKDLTIFVVLILVVNCVEGTEALECYKGTIVPTRYNDIKQQNPSHAPAPPLSTITCHGSCYVSRNKAEIESYGCSIVKMETKCHQLSFSISTVCYCNRNFCYDMFLSISDVYRLGGEIFPKNPEIDQLSTKQLYDRLPNDREVVQQRKSHTKAESSLWHFSSEEPTVELGTSVSKGGGLRCYSGENTDRLATVSCPGSCYVRLAQGGRRAGTGCSSVKMPSRCLTGYDGTFCYCNRSFCNVPRIDQTFSQRMEIRWKG